MSWRDRYDRLRAFREPAWFPVGLIVASCIPGVVAIGALVSDVAGSTSLLDRKSVV